MLLTLKRQFVMSNLCWMHSKSRPLVPTYYLPIFYQVVLIVWIHAHFPPGLLVWYPSSKCHASLQGYWLPATHVLKSFLECFKQLHILPGVPCKKSTIYWFDWSPVGQHTFCYIDLAYSLEWTCKTVDLVEYNTMWMDGVWSLDVPWCCSGYQPFQKVAQFYLLSSQLLG